MPLRLGIRVGREDIYGEHGVGAVELRRAAEG